MRGGSHSRKSFADRQSLFLWPNFQIWWVGWTVDPRPDRKKKQKRVGENNPIPSRSDWGRRIVLIFRLSVPEQNAQYLHRREHHNKRSDTIQFVPQVNL